MNAPSLPLPPPLLGELQRADGFSYYLHRCCLTMGPRLEHGVIRGAALKRFLGDRKAFQRFLGRLEVAP